MFLRQLLLLLMLSSSMKAFANQWTLSLGYGSGGAPLSDATGNSEHQAKAGSGMLLGGGYILPVSETHPHRFEGQLGVSYLMSTGGVSWSRIPLEALYYYHNTRENFRIGYGPVLHIGNRISEEKEGDRIETKFKNSFGWSAAAELLMPLDTPNGRMSLGIKYNNIKYRTQDLDREVDGTSWALTYGIIE